MMERDAAQRERHIAKQFPLWLRQKPAEVFVEYKTHRSITFML
jgi:hypothetical protein